MPQTGILSSWLRAELEGSINTAKTKAWASSTHSPAIFFFGTRFVTQHFTIQAYRLRPISKMKNQLLSAAIHLRRLAAYLEVVYESPIQQTAMPWWKQFLNTVSEFGPTFSPSRHLMQQRWVTFELQKHKQYDTGNFHSEEKPAVVTWLREGFWWLGRHTAFSKRRHKHECTMGFSDLFQTIIVPATTATSPDMAMCATSSERQTDDSPTETRPATGYSSLMLVTQQFYYT